MVVDHPQSEEESKNMNHNQWRWQEWKVEKRPQDMRLLELNRSEMICVQLFRVKGRDERGTHWQ